MYEQPAPGDCGGPTASVLTSERVYEIPTSYGHPLSQRFCRWYQWRGVVSGGLIACKLN